MWRTNASPAPRLHGAAAASNVSNTVEAVSFSLLVILSTISEFRKMGLVPRPSKLGRIRQRLTGKIPSIPSSGLATEPRTLSPNSGRTIDVDSAPAKVLSLPTPDSSPSPRMSSDSTLNASYTRDTSNILTDALGALDSGQRKIIKASISPDSTTIGAVLDEVHNRADELQKRSAMKGWTWSYTGRQIYLRDQADKLLQFLDKFKSWGNAVANIDPILVGLPWAGVRTILKVCTTRSSISFPQAD